MYLLKVLLSCGPLSQLDFLRKLESRWQGTGPEQQCAILLTREQPQALETTAGGFVKLRKKSQTYRTWELV